jgi:hypothetical protein
MPGLTHWYKVAAAANVQDADTMLRKCNKNYVYEMADANAKRDAAKALMVGRCSLILVPCPYCSHPCI